MPGTNGSRVALWDRASEHELGDCDRHQGDAEHREADGEAFVAFLDFHGDSSADGLSDLVSRSRTSGGGGGLVRVFGRRRGVKRRRSGAVTRAQRHQVYRGHREELRPCPDLPDADEGPWIPSWRHGRCRDRHAWGSTRLDAFDRITRIENEGARHRGQRQVQGDIDEDHHGEVSAPSHTGILPERATPDVRASSGADSRRE